MPPPGFPRRSITNRSTLGIFSRKTASTSFAKSMPILPGNRLTFTAPSESDAIFAVTLSGSE